MLDNSSWFQIISQGYIAIFYKKIYLHFWLDMQRKLFCIGFFTVDPFQKGIITFNEIIFYFLNKGTIKL